jgi:predicted nucleotidyltransferase
METFGISKKSYLLIVDVLKSYPEVEAAIIFGSRAKGNYKNGSDIDLALIGESLNSKVILDIAGILNEGISIPYHVDVVNYHSISTQELKEHIDRVGKEFYRKGC